MWPVIRTWMHSASNIRVYDAKKILVDTLGTLRTAGTCSL
jgi:hypothetical protein